jgi:hypothetical protein
VLIDAQKSTRATVQNVLGRYRDRLDEALEQAEIQRLASNGQARFAPPFALPQRSKALERYLATSDVGVAGMGRYRGKQLWLLDLMRNPGTRTTKTFGSLVIVGRAVRHIRETGERVMIITPSAANKATALRDAAARAIDSGLVSSNELNVVVVVPTSADRKLWMSSLAATPEQLKRHPVLMYPGAEREDVKALTHQFVDAHAGELWETHGIRVWDSLHVDNYKVADCIRAFAERDTLGEPEAGDRLHVHAVSSAYGFLGHHLGQRMLAAEHGEGALSARYLVVQHLETPDVVLDVHFGRVDLNDLPEFRYDRARGLYVQDESPFFPATTFDLDERLEPTFYTRRPPTLRQIRRLMATAGGTGMVVSLHECLERYGEVRAHLAAAGMERLPADPRKLREWALVMAVVGVLNAIDRGLVDEHEVVVHGSGCYSEPEFEPFLQHRARLVRDAEGIAAAVYDAAYAGS